MAVYVRAEALEVPAPSLSECSDSTIPDPDQIFPHRKGALGMIDNVLSQMFDDCWHELAKKETEKESQAKLEANNVAISKFVEMEEQFVSVHVSKQQIIAVTSSCKLCSFNAQGVAIDTWANPDEQSIQSCHIFPFDPIDRVIHVVVIDDLGGAFWLLHVEPFGFIELKSLTSGEGQRTKCDNISSSLNGTIICASLSSQTDSWVNVWRIPGQISAQWKKEIDSQPEATLSETGSLEEPLEPADASTYKWKPTLSFNAPPIKLKKPKHTIQPKRTSYAELKSAVDHEADVTGDENVYLLSDEMKTQRTETEEKSFKLNFPSEPIPTEEELAIELNSPCTVRVLDPVTSHSGETAGSRAGSRTGSGKMKRYSVAVSQPNATKLFIYSLVQKTPSGKVTPFVALPHTDKITTFTVDTVTTHYIATCCANGTITLWRRDSETHIVPVYVAPALNKVSCDLIFLSQPDNLQIPPVLIALDRAKTLFAIRHDQNKFLNVFNKRQEIFEGVQELYESGGGQIACVNNIFIYWTNNIADIQRKWKVQPSQTDLPSVCTKDDVFYFTEAGELKIGRFM